MSSNLVDLPYSQELKWVKIRYPEIIKAADFSCFDASSLGSDLEDISNKFSRCQKLWNSSSPVFLQWKKKRIKVIEALEDIACELDTHKRNCNIARLTGGSVGAVGDPVCLEHHMRCNDGTCMPLGAKCDGYTDCPDGSDELELCKGTMRQGNVHFFVNDGSDVEKAEEWISSQRDENYGWGADTARAVTALFLTNGQRYQGTKEGNLIKKQLAIETTTLVLRNSTNKISLTKLSSSVNALLATCQDPKSFSGLDLTRQLRIRTTQQMSANSTVAPLVFLTLCLTEMSIPEDFYYLYSNLNYSRAQGKIDLEAFTLLAMSCIVKDKLEALRSVVSEEVMQYFAKELAKRFESLKTATDVYTTAVVIQALNAIGYEKWSRNFWGRLLSYQDANGSFGDILATYYALPALIGESLLSLKYINCSSESYGSRAILPSRQSQKEVKYSLWLGNPVTRTHTMSLTIDSNWTVIEMMEYAAEKNELFGFLHEDTPKGPSVYSVASIPNDAEREFQWASYIKSNAIPKQAAPKQEEYSQHKVLTINLHYKPKDGDNVVLWYKSSKEGNS